MRRLMWLVVLVAGCVAIPSLGDASTKAPAAPSPPAAPAAPVDPLEQQLLQAMQQQAQIQAAKLALSGQVAAAQDQQSNLRSLITVNQKAIQDTLAKLADAERRFQDATRRAADDRARAVEARRHEREDKALLAVYIRQRYVQQQSLISFLLSSNSFPEFMGRASALNHLAASDNRLVRKVQEDALAAEKAERAAQADADAAQAAAATLAVQKAGLDDQVAKEQTLVDRLGGDVAAATAEISQADKQDAALVQRIAALRIQQLDQTIAEAEQAAWQEAAFYLQNHLTGLPPGVGDDPEHPPTVRFLWAVPGSVITQPFGPSPYDFEPPFAGFPHFHTGIDMAAPLGTPVFAVADGIVAAASTSTVGYGNHVIIAHDGHTLTLYGHLQVMLVHAGDTVHQGQPIGLMGSTGNSTGPHTHFELRVDNIPVDPAPFLPPLPRGASGPPPLPKQ
ncbi:MAG: hypothetical protein E6J14_13520 [Chloroflexi bacterium]|nr:MAG: hypothetical protein E6J14_13520 [Chloroflexota bacterium]